MAKEHATGYDAPKYVPIDLAHPLGRAQSEYSAARRPMIGLADYFKKYPDHKSWARGGIERFDKAQANLINTIAKHENRTKRAVQLDFKTRANQAHSAASKIQKAYKKHKTSKGGRRRTRRGRGSRYTRRR